MDKTGAVLRTEAAIEYSQVLILEMRSALNCAGGVDMRYDLLHLMRSAI